MNILFMFLVLYGELYYCRGYKILAIFPMAAGSHYVLNSRIANELAIRGHEVTHVTPYPQKNPHKNLKEISLENIVDIINEAKKDLLELEKQGLPGICRFVDSFSIVLTENTLKNEEIQKILQSKEKFDVVLTSVFVNEGLLGIAYHLQVPLVLVASMPLMPWTNFYLAHPSPPSYVPNLFGSYSAHMNFWQRLVNSFYDLYSITYHQWFTLPKHRELVKKYIPGQPDLYDFLNNESITLINSHMSSYEALPKVPNAIEIGGAHIQKPKSLSEELQKFLNDSIEGVVVFSMGSNLKSADLPIKTRDEILKAFFKLKQKILMKWELDELPGLPQNVKLVKWLPQSDILAHSNVKALITHGGLMSTLESVHYGVPMIGIPIFSDQKMNMAIAAFYGYGITVSFQELNENTLAKALDQVLNNPEYSINAQKHSKIMRDRPMEPIDSAIYWIEYTVRHQGAPHLKYPGANLAWFQRNLLDVIAFVLVTVFLSVSVIFAASKRILRRICHVHDKKVKRN